MALRMQSSKLENNVDGQCSQLSLWKLKYLLVNRVINFTNRKTIEHCVNIEVIAINILGIRFTYNNKPKMEINLPNRH